MYGILQPGKKVKIKENELEVSCTSTSCVYRRFHEGRLEREVFFNRLSKIIIHPTIYTGFTDCLFIRFSHIYGIGPKTVVRIPIILPIDIGVTLVSRVVKVIDTIPRKKVKYALYGRPERGEVCRYVKQEDKVPDDEEEMT